MKKIIIGLIIVIVHQLKLVPPGVENFSFLMALVGVWAYAGLFIGIGLIVAGLNQLGFIDWLMNKLGD